MVSTPTTGLRHDPPQAEERIAQNACAPIESFFGKFFGSKESSTGEDEDSEEGTPNEITLVRNKVTLEMVHYQGEPMISTTQSPLEWWRSKQYAYPTLARLAKVRLAVQATSVAAERVFSTAGDIVNEKRSRLAVDHVDSLLFLKKNYELSESDD